MLLLNEVLSAKTRLMVILLDHPFYVSSSFRGLFAYMIRVYMCKPSSWKTG